MGKTTVNNSSWLTTLRKWAEIGEICTVASTVGATAGHYLNNYLNQLETQTPGSNYNPETDDPLSWWGASLIGATISSFSLILLTKHNLFCSNFPSFLISLIKIVFISTLSLASCFIKISTIFLNEHFYQLIFHL